MTSSFDELVQQEIHLVIPSDHFEEVKRSSVPGLDGYSFRAPLQNEQYRLIHVLTLNAAFILNTLLEDRLLAMRDRLESQQELLLVISESESFMTGSDLHDFISESFRIDSPYFFAISCYRDRELLTTIDGSNFEELHQVIRDIWSGSLRFDGPVRGLQPVNIELMKDTCWKCKQPMRTVTGLVFPDQQLSRWDNDHWLYYNQLAALQDMPDNHALTIQAFAEDLRKKDPLVTPVTYRYSNFVDAFYWAAGCPHCDALRGNFYLQEARMDHLHDLASRRDGTLQYYPVAFHVDQPLIKFLGAGFEYCPHTRIMGWERLNV